MTLFWFMSNMLFMNLNYEIMPVKDMFNDITDRHSQYIDFDPNTMAKTYRGNSGSYYLIPAIGPLGIKAQKEVIDSIIKSGVIPIEEKEPNPFKMEKERLLDIPENIDYYVSDLAKKLEIEIRRDEEIDILLYKEINKKIKALDAGIAYERYFIPLGVVVGELVRKRVNGEWKVEKRYGYNPYYVPRITDRSNNNYLPWYKLAEMLLKKKFDIGQYIEDVSKARSFF